MFNFNKISKKAFAAKDVEVWVFEEDGELIANITEDISNENECSTADYKIEQTANNFFTFTLFRSWTEKELPKIIQGETEFRKFVKSL